MNLFKWMLIFFVSAVVMIHFLPGTAQDDGNTIPPAAEVFDFPHDHYSHFDAPWRSATYGEWHYFTGILIDNGTGQQFGYQITLFAAMPDQQSATFVYEIALSDLENQAFWHTREALIKPNWQAAPLIFENEHFQLRVLDDGGWRIRFDGTLANVATQEERPARFNIFLRVDSKDYILHTPDGIGPMGECAREGSPDTLQGYSYYYSNPRLASDFRLSLGDSQYHLEGNTWFDHQWGNYMHCDLAWNWFSLRFADGGDIMLFQFLDESGQESEVWLGASYNDGTGRSVIWQEEQISFRLLRYWENPRTNVLFPLDWEIETPLGTFGIIPVFDDQSPERTPILPYYWEGVVEIRAGGIQGELLSLGYLEVVPADPSRELPIIPD